MHISETGFPCAMNERSTLTFIGFRERKNMRMMFAVIFLYENI